MAQMPVHTGPFPRYKHIMFYVLAILCLAAVGLGYVIWTRQRTRARLLATPLTASQRAIMLDAVPLLSKLPNEMHVLLEGKMSLFLHQVRFIGCNGLEVTEEMELSIAAQACLLIVNTDAWYTHLRTILIYPDAFKSKSRQSDGYVVKEVEIVRTGESWLRGPVILSWAHSQQGATNFEDGHNVVLHEFAHQLDDLSGRTNGVPRLRKDHSFDEWRSIFVDAYQRHAANINAGKRTVLDAYGTTGPEEFFAVAIEVFIEKPADLQREEPDIYAQLAKLLQLDPVDW